MVDSLVKTSHVTMPFVLLIAAIGISNFQFFEKVSEEKVLFLIYSNTGDFEYFFKSLIGFFFKYRLLLLTFEILITSIIVY